MRIKRYQQICTIFIIPHRKHSVVQWCDIKIDKHPQTCCCSALNWIILLLRFYILYIRLYIYIGTVFFFIGQWDWFVIAFLWSVIPLDSRLQSSTSDVMYTCKPILAFKVRFHAPLSPRRVPSKKYQSGSGKFCSTDSHSCVIY